VVLVTLKGRTLTPPAELFLDGLREHVRELGLVSPGLKRRQV
jgi:hypothetical protein